MDSVSRGTWNFNKASPQKYCEALEKGMAKYTGSVDSADYLPDLNVVKETLAINYYGTVYATNQFLTIIRSGGRLVNVASMVGTLDKYSSTIRNRFLSAKSEDDIIQLMRDFEASVAAGKEKQDGWPSAAYAVSKAGLIGATKAIAERQKSKDKSVLINACCPGFVNTDMTKGRGHKTPDEGAKTPVLLALADIAGQTGFFWQSEKPIEW